jgi:hypothetical protein
VTGVDRPGRVEAYEDALRTIAAATVTARSKVSGFHLPPEAGAALLVECERALAALMAVGYVPRAPDPNARRLLTYERPELPE